VNFQRAPFCPSTEPQIRRYQNISAVGVHSFSLQLPLHCSPAFFPSAAVRCCLCATEPHPPMTTELTSGRLNLQSSLSLPTRSLHLLPTYPSSTTVQYTPHGTFVEYPHPYAIHRGLEQLVSYCCGASALTLP